MNIDKYIFKGHTDFDVELYKKFSKDAIRNIAIGNFSRLALDKVKECLEVKYPTNTEDPWQLEPKKITTEIEVVVMSVSDLEKLMKDLMQEIADKKKEEDNHFVTFGY